VALMLLLPVLLPPLLLLVHAAEMCVWMLSAGAAALPICRPLGSLLILLQQTATLPQHCRNHAATMPQQCCNDAAICIQALCSSHVCPGTPDHHPVPSQAR
jgi:hypothetical protein